jgi:hypothetical protein
MVHEMSFAETLSLMRMPAVVFVVVLVMVCVGCGSSVPDESANPQPSPMAYTSQAERASTPPSLPMSNRTMDENKIEENANQTASVSQSGEHTSTSISALPLSVAKDLHSPEARDRYRALDHWETKDSKASLDPVFEALEDDDPAVRAKATAIVERYWEAEEEREK